MLRRSCMIAASICIGMTFLLLLLLAPRIASSREQSSSIIISEIAWQGTAFDSSHEWIELFNPSPDSQSIGGWILSDEDDLNITLIGTVPGLGFFLLEHTQQTISDITADQMLVGSLDDSGEALYLRDADGVIIDMVNVDGGGWPAGTTYPDYRSMERITPAGPTTDAVWISNDINTRNGLDAISNPINGTPGQPNSYWLSDMHLPELVITKTAPITATAGQTIQYSLVMTNVGLEDATNVVLTDILPNGFNYLRDDAPVAPVQVGVGILEWELGTVPTGTMINIELTTTIGYGIQDSATNYVMVASNPPGENTQNNEAYATTWVNSATEPTILLEAVHWSGHFHNQLDEAVKLINVSGGLVDLADWKISDNEGEATFPNNTYLSPGEKIWVARNASSFRQQFGYLPDFEIEESMLEVKNLSGSGPRFADSGDEVLLVDLDGQIHDALVYKAGNVNQSGWIGPAVEPYTLHGVFGDTGQILYRKRDPLSGLPVPDTNTSHDWAQTAGGDPLGRLVQYPGWDLERFFFPASFTETSTISLGVAPDNPIELILPIIQQANVSIHIESLTFRSWQVASQLIAAINRGVSVKILLEGSPPGGIDDQQKLICQQINQAGGDCWFMISNAEEHIFNRYRYLHAKFMIIDERVAVVSTENLSPDSFPVDDPTDGTLGHRGLVIATDSPGVVNSLSAIWSSDFDPANHADIFQWQAADPIYGDPPDGTIPITLTGGSGYDLRYPETWSITGTFAIQVSQSPENTLRNIDGILYLIGQAELGDTILFQQLSERPHWGGTSSTSSEDPNPRLELAINAARRGAIVYLMLDSYYDSPSDPLSNWATCQHIEQVARSEHLDMHCTLANPTGLGIHNKLILVNLDNQGYTHVGSTNGTELSHKGNREVSLLIRSNELYEELAGLFFADWPNEIYLPLIMHRYIGPALNPLLSEIYYNPPGSIEDDEFIEIANPTSQPFSLAGFSIGDATNRSDFEDVRRFPPATTLQPGQTVVIATTATGFKERFGSTPDFEIVETDWLVPNLIDDPSWGDPGAILRLGNSGDEVYLRDGSDLIIDAVAYGTGSVAGQVSCQTALISGHSLERFPFWRDTNDCLVDFRDWPFPNPGSLP